MTRGLAPLVLVASFALAAASCGPSQGVQPVAWLDRAAFERDIEPIVERQCADPTCHGRPERPLSLYAPLRWRADASRTHLPELLTADEVTHNWTAACLCASYPTRGEESLFAKKPLAGAGLYHGGGAQWDGPTDPSYRAVLAWIRGAP